MLRRRELTWSTTTILPSVFTTTPCGWLKLAAVPWPSAEPAEPLPAKVETTPRGDTSLMRLFIRSVTTMVPLAGMKAMPHGWLNLAAAFTPSAKAPVPPFPAIVATKVVL